MKVAVIKYNAGNIRSVDYALRRLGVEAEITADEAVLRAADKVIFPAAESLDGGHIIYTIDSIDYAIKNNCQISFKYFDYTADYKKAYRRNGEIYIADPVAMMWNMACGI